jgi:perosamine synthetase
VVTVATCTHALELSLRALRLPAGSRVLTPSLTFCGAVAAIVHAGYQPVLVDLEEATLVPSAADVEAAVARSGPAAAMVVCDLGGYPVDQVALADAAALPYGRIVVDAAHGPGGRIGRAEAGTAPFATCLSFYATKNLPIGEGGAVATYDGDFAAWLRCARLHGMSRDAWRRYLPGGSWRYDVPEIGFKANLTDLQAAIGRAQLGALPAWQDERTQLVKRYDEALADAVTAGLVRMPDRPDGHSLHLYQVRVGDRDAVIERLTAAGIGTSVHFIPVHHLTYFRSVCTLPSSGLAGADHIFEQLLSLPLYPSLRDDQVDRVAEALRSAVSAKVARP